MELGGGQVSVGLVGYMPPFGNIRGFDIASVQAQLSLLQTWGSPRLVAQDQAYVGAEIQVTLFLLGMRIGYFRRVRGMAPGEGDFVSAGFIVEISDSWQRF